MPRGVCRTPSPSAARAVSRAVCLHASWTARFLGSCRLHASPPIDAQKAPFHGLAAFELEPAVSPRHCRRRKRANFPKYPMRFGFCRRNAPKFWHHQRNARYGNHFCCMTVSRPAHCGRSGDYRNAAACRKRHSLPCCNRGAGEFIVCGTERTFQTRQTRGGSAQDATGYSRVRMTPDTIRTVAIILPLSIRSPNNNQPRRTANRIEVSRRAATRAKGATVMAQTTIA